MHADYQQFSQCVGTLAARNVLFEVSSSTGVTYVGPCGADDGYGTCVGEKQQPRFNYCSTECQAQIEQVSIHGIIIRLCAIRMYLCCIPKGKAVVVS